MARDKLDGHTRSRGRKTIIASEKGAEDRNRREYCSIDNVRALRL
jgi:hypothetical protein